ncbi:hypothetical protein GY45DRAFT_366416 [Cubamyces sp. BRFM 1775]|nr:hypothetical protein GY45DRAFT_366416 [Cubamyces sp. BRFM 1775]
MLKEYPYKFRALRLVDSRALHGDSERHVVHEPGRDAECIRPRILDGQARCAAAVCAIEWRRVGSAAKTLSLETCTCFIQHAVIQHPAPAPSTASHGQYGAGRLVGRMTG